MKKLIFIFLIVFNQTVYAEYQTVALKADNLITNPGNFFDLSLLYDVSDGDNALSGLSLAIHFDSNKLQLLDKKITNIFSFGASAPLIRNEKDTENDNDENTDKVVVFFWSKPFDNNWPNQSLPLELAKLKFIVKSVTGKTNINTSALSTSLGYEFKATNICVKIIKKGDSNMDGYINIKDILNLLNYIIKL